MRLKIGVGGALCAVLVSALGARAAVVDVPLTFTVTATDNYGMAGADGHNPNWAVLGYPGPPGLASDEPKPCQASACRATIGSINRSPSAPIQIGGCGFCTGWGRYVACSSR